MNNPAQSSLPSPAPDTCVAYLIRHGATPASAAKPVLMQGRRTDTSLSAAGLAQAEATATFLAKHRVDALYSSPMARARETALAVGKPHALAPTPIEALIEADLGTWEGLSWEQIKERDAAAYQNFVERPDLHGYGGGESLTQVADRALPALRDLLAQHRGQVIAVVSHRIVIRACAATLIGMPLASGRRLDPATCGISVLRLRGEELSLETFNATFHLHPW